MTAALFGKLFQGLYDIELVESEAIGTVGVGEATIPAIKKYNELIQLDEAEFMRRTQATFKLGIEFVDWVRPGHSYIHGFGIIGQDWEWLRCHQYWLRANQRGRAAGLRRLFDQHRRGACEQVHACAARNGGIADRPYRLRVPVRRLALCQISALACRAARRQADRRAGSSTSRSPRMATSRRSRSKAAAGRRRRLLHRLLGLPRTADRADAEDRL